MSAAESPCTACGWSSQRQKSCCYDSHVKLFYGVSDRGAWALGSKFILKERSNSPPNFEAKNIRFLSNNTTIPIPSVVDEWTEQDGRYFELTKRIPGEPLSAVWATMSLSDKERVAKQTAEYVLQLRQLQSAQIQSLGGQPVYSTFLFPNGYGVPHGPLSSDDELWAEMEKSLQRLPNMARQWLRSRLPPSRPFTFTHGDLTNVNIMVENGNLTGIIDWEASGYFPVWWEYTCAGIGIGSDDQEWKSLLRRYMSSYSEGHEFWLDFYALSRYPKLNQRGEDLLKRITLDEISLEK
jgi:aminoglycoside phosphotransferase